jgi:putative ABC transport system substrate-binding protein
MSGRRMAVMLAASVLAVAQPAIAQTEGRVYRIGYIGWVAPTSPEAIATVEVFRRGLREGGFEEGRNLKVERRYARGIHEQEERFAAEFVEMKVDLILAAGSGAALAAKRATSTIPIVMLGAANPERTGLVANLARPGGNVTGTSNLNVELNVKLYELVKEALPQVSRVGIPWNPGNPASVHAIKTEVEFVRALGMTPIPIGVQTAADLDRAFEVMLRERVDLLAPHLAVQTHFPRIFEFAAKHGLPVAGAGSKEIAQAGGLMSLSGDMSEALRRGALIVVKILKGANPGDVPVEQLTKTVLVINLKAAKALGLSIPRSVLLRADDVIE